MQRESSRLVATSSSDQPPPDVLRMRWRRRPALAFAVRAVVLLAPLLASVAVGVIASRQFRPHDWLTLVLWVLWTGAASLLALWAVDVLARRLLPLHRLLQLCLAFPDRAPSRLRIAARAARSRRPEALLTREDAPPTAAVVAEQVVTLLAALAIHDRRTRGHCERVCAYSGLLAEQMRLSESDRERISWVALVHDIGKLHVPARLLNKPGRPTVAEWRLLKTHPERGAAMTEPLRDWLGPWADAVLQHHERYDGAGYPHGLAGEEISMAARLIAVTDAFEVMTAPRAYRRAVDAQTARAELARQAGTQFDPDVVRQFLAIGLPRLRRAMGPLAWLGQVPFVSSWPRLEVAASSTAAHAVTATAAASTAGLLALGSAGPGTAVAASPGGGGSGVLASGPSDGVSTPVQVDPASTGGAAATAESAVESTRSQSGRSAHAAGSGHSARRQVSSESTRVARAGDVRLTSSGTSGPTRSGHGPRSTGAPHHAPAQSSSGPDAVGGQSSGAQGAPVQDSSDGSSDGTSSDARCGHGQHRGHDHAPGWQKNWGKDGRQAQRHGGSSGGSDGCAGQG